MIITSISVVAFALRKGDSLFVGYVWFTEQTIISINVINQLIFVMIMRFFVRVTNPTFTMLRIWMGFGAG
jgi:hypothetical protein